MVVTRHAKKRMKQRCGIGKKTARKMAEKALKYGISHKELTGPLCNYVNGIYLSKKKANNIKIYGNQLYLFHNVTLMTVLYIPEKYYKELEAIKANKRKGENDGNNLLQNRQ